MTKVSLAGKATTFNWIVKPANRNLFIGSKTDGTSELLCSLSFDLVNRLTGKDPCLSGSRIGQLLSATAPGHLNGGIVFGGGLLEEGQILCAKSILQTPKGSGRQ